MIIEEYVKVNRLKPGDKISKTIYDEHGRVMLKNGNILSNGEINIIKRMGYKGIYIESIAGQERNDIPVQEPLFEDFEILQVINIIKDLYNCKNLEMNFYDPVFTVNKGKIEKILYEFVTKIYITNKTEGIMYDSIDSRSEKTSLYYHALNTAILSAGIAIKMGFDKEKCYNIAVGGLYHDLGKIFFPDAEIFANIKYSEENVSKPNTILDHPVRMYRILQRLNYPTDTNIAVFMHHERCDGSGFPNHLSGDKIPVSAKIVGLASSYDNLINFSYGNDTILNNSEALEKISADSKYDLECRKALLNFVAPYTIGERVKLSNGEIGIIFKNNTQTPLRPWVATKSCFLDLANDENCRFITIIESCDK